MSAGEEDDGLMVPVYPDTFDELGAGRGGDACRRCGDTATYGVTIHARKLGQHGGASKASHKTTLCEGCAVQIFAATRKAMR